jgi:hypothetical protein
MAVRVDRRRLDNRDRGDRDGIVPDRWNVRVDAMEWRQLTTRDTNLEKIWLLTVM